MDPKRIENGIERGTPDVNYTGGWIELKFAERWPVRGGPLHIAHCTPEQRAWHLTRAQAGGRVWVMLKVAQEWYLFEIGAGTEHLWRGTLTKELAKSTCRGYWNKTVDAVELKGMLS